MRERDSARPVAGRFRFRLDRRQRDRDSSHRVGLPARESASISFSRFAGGPVRVASITTLAIVVSSLGLAPATGHRSPPLATAVFAGGCFWSVEAIFEHVRGVTDAVSGFSGASLEARDYVRPFRGTTGYAETVKVTYDSTQVSYDQLLRVFFTVAHDPTEVDRQGPDEGAEYRSVIFFVNDAQRRAALAYIDSLEKTKSLKAAIATQVAPFKSFRVAPEEHQNFVVKNPTSAYVVNYDLPKLEHFRHDLPALFREH